MKKKLVAIIVTTMCLLALTACNADDLNSTIESAASAAGVEVDINIKQEQLDEVKKKAKDSADKIKDIATDEDVHKAAKDLLDSVINSTKESDDVK